MPARLDAINESTAITPIRSDVSMSLHPDILAGDAAVLVDSEQTDAGATAYAAGRRALQALYTSAAAIDQAHEDILKPTETGRSAATGKPIVSMQVPPERADELRTAMAQSFQRAAVGSATAIAAVDSSIGALETQIATALKHPRQDATATATAAAQIRQFVRELPPTERMNTLHRLVFIEKDAEVACAILASSPWTSGLDRSELARVREMAAEALAPRAFKQLGAAKKVRAHLDVALETYSDSYSRKLPPERVTAQQKSMAKLRIA